jgi:hypothetical protein
MKTNSNNVTGKRSQKTHLTLISNNDRPVGLPLSEEPQVLSNDLVDPPIIAPTAKSKNHEVSTPVPLAPDTIRDFQAGDDEDSAAPITQ